MAGIDSNTKLVIHADGTDAATTFTDQSDSRHTVTAVGNAQVDTSQSKFGGASAQFDGTGDYLTVADHDDWSFGAGEFTIDFWVRWTSVGSNQTLAAQWLGTGNQRAWLLYYSGTNLVFQWSTDGSGNASVSKAWAPSNDVWYHVEVVRTGNVIRMFVGGSQLSTDGAITDTIFASTSPLNIGAFNSDGSFPFNGRIDEFRISKGVARHTTTFTPPTVPYSTDGAAALTGTGSLSGTATLSTFGAAALTGTGSLSAAGTLYLYGSASLTGTGTLSATGALVWYGTSALTGTGTLSATGLRTVVGVGALTGTGTLSVTGYNRTRDIVPVVEGSLTLTPVSEGSLTLTPVS